MKPGSTVSWVRSITRASFAWPCPWASGPTALMRSPSIRMPTPARGVSPRPSIKRPALMRVGGATLGRGACAATEVQQASEAASGRERRIGRLLGSGEAQSPPTRVPVKALKLRAEVLMTTTATAPERRVSADEAREVAEAPPEPGRAGPDFVRDLFLDRLRRDLIRPA